MIVQEDSFLRTNRTMNMNKKNVADAGPKPKITRRRLHPDDRRQQIIDGAVAFFAEVGLDGNTRDLAKKIGITQSLLFKYFATKGALIEAVYEQVYLNRLSPEWAYRIADRGVPLRDRILAFYSDYSTLIFEYNWMRIFMFSGLAGAELNRRYLDHMHQMILRPLLEEIRVASPGAVTPTMEDLWNLHGGIVYIGIRQHIYRMPYSADPNEAIERSVDRFLKAFSVETT